MSSIFMEKYSYELLVMMLSSEVEAMNVAADRGLTTGRNVSEAMEAYYDIFNDLTVAVRAYKWSLQHLVEALRQAEEELETADDFQLDF